MTTIDAKTDTYNLEQITLLTFVKMVPVNQNAVLGTSFQTPGVPFLPKMSYFQSRGHNFD